MGSSTGWWVGEDLNQLPDNPVGLQHILLLEKASSFEEIPVLKLQLV